MGLVTEIVLCSDICIESSSVAEDLGLCIWLFEWETWQFEPNLFAARIRSKSEFLKFAKATKQPKEQQFQGFRGAHGASYNRLSKRRPPPSPRNGLPWSFPLTLVIGPLPLEKCLPPARNTNLGDHWWQRMTPSAPPPPPPPKIFLQTSDTSSLVGMRGQYRGQSMRVTLSGLQLVHHRPLDASASAESPKVLSTWDDSRKFVVIAVVVVVFMKRFQMCECP